MLLGMRLRRFVSIVALGLSGFAACDLNPQPEVPSGEEGGTGGGMSFGGAGAKDAGGGGAGGAAGSASGGFGGMATGGAAGGGGFAGVVDAGPDVDDAADGETDAGEDAGEDSGEDSGDEDAELDADPDATEHVPRLTAEPSPCATLCRERTPEVPGFPAGSPVPVGATRASLGDTWLGGGCPCCWSQRCSRRAI